MKLTRTKFPLPTKCPNVVVMWTYFSVIIVFCTYYPNCYLLFARKNALTSHQPKNGSLIQLLIFSHTQCFWSSKPYQLIMSVFEMRFFLVFVSRRTENNVVEIRINFRGSKMWGQCEVSRRWGPPVSNSTSLVHFLDPPLTYSDNLVDV